MKSCQEFLLRTVSLASAGIPVTHRGAASSVHIITGHEHPAKPSEALDFSVIAKEEGTLVFLMGLRSLEYL